MGERKSPNGIEAFPFYKGDRDMSRVQSLILALLLIAFTGCGSADKPATEQQQPEAQQPQQQPPAVENTQQPSQPKPSTAMTSSRETSRAAKTTPKVKTSPPASAEPSQTQQTATASPPAAETPAVQKAPEPRYAMLAAGTVIPVRLEGVLDSGVNKSGDTFRAIVDKDLLVGGAVVVPRGSVVEGEVTQVERSGRVSGRAAISLQLLKLHIVNQPYTLRTETLSFEAESTKTKDATKVGIGAGLGAVIGAIAGGGKGAAIGAAAGAGAGGATVLATRGKEIKLEAEHQLSFTLSQDVSVKLR